MRSWGNLKITVWRVAILHGVLYMSKGWENALGNLKFGKSRFLTHPNLHLVQPNLIFMTYHDHRHPIEKKNPYKLAKQ